MGVCLFLLVAFAAGGKETAHVEARAGVMLCFQ
jgi:hypothetical protein